MKSYFIYRIKILLKQKTIIFWAFIFPLILTGMFSLVMRNLLIKSEPTLKVSNVALVSTIPNSDLDKELSNYKFNDKKLFKVKKMNIDKAEASLKDKKVIAIIIEDKNIALQVNNSSFEVSYLKSYLDTYQKVGSAYANIAMVNQGKITLPDENYTSPLSSRDTKDKVEDSFLLPFVSAIAMAILFTSYFTLCLENTNNPRFSASGARLSIAPYNKLKMAFIDLSLVTIIGFIVGMNTYLYINYFLNINTKINLTILIPIIFLGSLISSLFGYVVGIIFVKKPLTFNINIITSLTMVGSLFSGMMAPNIKSMIEQNIPIINKINPVYLITDSIYKAHYNYETTYIYNNIMYLGLMVLLLALYIFITLRRKNYDSL